MPAPRTAPDATVDSADPAAGPAPAATADTGAASSFLGAVLQPVLDSAPDAGFLLDPSGVVRRVGAPAGALLGGSPGSWVGRHARELVAPELSRAFSRRISWLARRPGSQVADVLVAVPHLDGSTVAVSAWLGEVDGTGHVMLWLHALPTPQQPVEALLEPEVARRGSDLVQAVTAAAYAHQRGDSAVVDQALATAAATARDVAGLLAEATARTDVHRALSAGADLALAPAGATRAPSSPETSTHDGVVSVLVADAGAMVRSQLRRILGAVPGVEVVDEVADGTTAVDRALRWQPELMLVDLELPGLDGLEVIRRVRECSPDTHVLALSGWSREASAVEALTGGASAFLEKGGAVSRFGAVVDELFPDRDRSGGLTLGRTEVPRAPTGRETDLVGVYAHELRSPITAQLLAVDLMLESDLDDDTRLLAGRLRSNAVKMNRLVQRMCDANRVGTGNLDLVKTRTGLGDLVGDLLASLDHVVDHTRCRLEVVVDAVVGVDAFAMGQVLENLVSNAVKFGEPGGAIAVRVVRDGDRAAVEVSDHGTGIAVEDRDRVFGKFARLGASAPGIGLGMFLSREIARAHGGDLAVVDGPTGGATFRLSLPVLT